MYIQSAHEEEKHDKAVFFVDSQGKLTTNLHGKVTIDMFGILKVGGYLSVDFQTNFVCPRLVFM